MNFSALKNVGAALSTANACYGGLFFRFYRRRIFAYCQFRNLSNTAGREFWALRGFAKRLAGSGLLRYGNPLIDATLSIRWGSDGARASDPARGDWSQRIIDEALELRRMKFAASRGVRNQRYSGLRPAVMLAVSLGYRRPRSIIAELIA